MIIACEQHGGASAAGHHHDDFIAGPPTIQTITDRARFFARIFHGGQYCTYPRHLIPVYLSRIKHRLLGNQTPPS